jgi:uncharacterized protein (DUF1330 family)
MAFEVLVGLFVVDQQRYSQYREEIAPLLSVRSARFRYDFEISRVLKNDGSGDINRVFVLEFPDQNNKEAFFADPVYLEIRARLFSRAVTIVQPIAEYQT